VRVAVLYDIHGNLPALEAVLEDVRSAGVDRVVIGGDVVPGPMPRETLAHLLALEWPTQFIRGNCERTVLAQMAVADPHAATYWGTTSGRPLTGPILDAMRWTAEQLLEYEAILAGWPRMARLDVDGLGEVCFFHATPRSETEVFTRATAESRLRPLLDPLGAAVAMCGHTHMRFDRYVGRTRLVNPGSVGSPFGETGAFWALLGPGVELRRTDYDRAAAAVRCRATSYPLGEEFAAELLEPPAEEKMIELYSAFELTDEPASGSPPVAAS
jgi:predicted phosphodiesterase